MTHDDGLIREDMQVPGEAGTLFLRRVSAGAAGSAPPMLLIHGARVPGVPSFDLAVPGGSLAADLARAGLEVYIGDLRGYGYSDRLPEMERDPAESRPLVRVREAARDIGAMVDAIAEMTGRERVSLLGWATGGMWCGFYAALHPERIERLVLYNALYRSPGHPSLGVGSSLEDPERPGQFAARALGGYRFNAASGLLGAWDDSIPADDKSEWRDPAVVAAYVEAALASDATSGEREPPSFRAPTGALEDSFYQACGRQLYDASLIESPTLVIAGERDFWSQPADREELAAHLCHAPEMKIHVIPDATHFVHLDRSHAGRDEFLRVVTEFLLPDDNVT